MGVMGGTLTIQKDSQEKRKEKEECRRRKEKIEYSKDGEDDILVL
ncbi:hypothetical protein AGMMS49531_01520 [Endomicrobiia bacterium]|nr:hypothetical protein AGMMS49531_01520 [Endomicrobiia bacterium]